MRCPTCSAEVPPGARFCPSCASPTGGVDAAGSGPDAPTELAAPAASGSPPSSQPPSKTSRLASAPALDGSRFLPGTLLADRYRIVAVLGRGGMGEVYRADDLKLGQSVALKFLPEAAAENQEWLDRFLNEVKIARQISNPNVCRVYDVGEVDGQHFLSMEYIDGEDLGSLLRRIGRLPEAKAVQIARQICAGLAAAHDQGVLHRDIKPANVMIDGRGNARLTDFGLAGLAETLADDVSSGTPAYMAPEQLAGREVTVRSDLWALGLVLYELFTGQQAFEAGSMVELSRLQQESAPAFPTSVVESLSPAVERVILRCLERDPQQRPKTALEVSAALPGGDPLVAALAAGETPSPEMVAAGGEEGVLSSRAALALLLGSALATLLFIAVAGRYQAPARLPLDLPPDVLIHRAKQVLADLGASDEEIADSAWGFSYDADLTRHLQSEWQGRREPLEAVAGGRPALLRFWYRQSPRRLVPLRNNPQIVSWGEPPNDSSGMTSIRLDTLGRLLELVRVPPQIEDGDNAAPAPAPDWEALFAVAELDMEAFTPQAPAWTPPVFADRRAAWTGRLPELADVEIRLEAAAYRGKPVYFELIGPWSRAERQVSVQQSGRNRVIQIVLLSILLLVLVASILTARHNVKAGRGDRRGAFRIAVALLLLNLATWLLSAHHVASLGAELILFIFALGLPLFVSSLTWLLYVALEPYLRRHQPHWLVAWSRLLTGRYRDPLVGRDVLIGLALGVALAVAGAAAAEIQMRLEPELSLPAQTPAQLMQGLAPASAWLIGSIQGTTFIAMITIFVWFLFRLVLRSDRIAAAVVVALLILLSSAGGGFSWVNAATAAAIAVFLLLVTARYGLLTLIAAIFTSSALSSLSLSFDLSPWWSRPSWACLAALALLAIWAFRTALGGRPILAESSAG